MGGEEKTFKNSRALSTEAAWSYLIQTGKESKWLFSTEQNNNWVTGLKLPDPFFTPWVGGGWGGEPPWVGSSSEFSLLATPFS